MYWWGWVVAGVLLLAVELLAIDAQFYLIFVGVGAIVVGLALWLGLDLPLWAQWLLFAFVSLAFMFTLRRQLYEEMRGRAVGVDNSVVGKTLVVPEDLDPGKSCRAEYRGTTWTAVNSGKERITAGSSVRIEVVDGLTLHVREQR